MEKYTIFNFGLLHLEWTNALFVLTVFSVLVFLLHFLLFKPVLRTVLNREKNQGSSEKEILQLQAEKEQTIQKTQEVVIFVSFRKTFQMEKFCVFFDLYFIYWQIRILI